MLRKQRVQKFRPDVEIGGPQGSKGLSKVKEFPLRGANEQAERAGGGKTPGARRGDARRGRPWG